MFVFSFPIDLTFIQTFLCLPHFETLFEPDAIQTVTSYTSNACAPCQGSRESMLSSLQHQLAEVSDLVGPHVNTPEWRRPVPRAVEGCCGCWLKGRGRLGAVACPHSTRLTCYGWMLCEHPSWAPG